MEWRFRSASQVFNEVIQIAKADYPISVQKKALQISSVFNAIPIDSKITSYWDAFLKSKVPRGTDRDITSSGSSQCRTVSSATGTV